MQHDAALERRKAQRSDEELPNHDQRDHPTRRDALVDEHHEHGEDEDLVGRGVEQRPERG